MVGALVWGACRQAPNLQNQMKCNWTQWGQSAAHQGQGCVPGQSPDRLLARLSYDPLTEVEAADTPGDDGAPELIVHYPAPLTVDDDVYLVVKGGAYVPCDPVGSGGLPDGGGDCGPYARAQLSWSVKALHWNGDRLEEQWTWASDWKPVTADLAFWEPPLQPAVAGDYLWVPGAGGTLDQVERSSGKRKKRIDPFGDSKWFAVSGVAAGVHGDLYYAALKVDPNDAFASSEGQLVHVTYDGDASKAAYTALVPGAPGPNDTCAGVFRQPPEVAPFPPLDDGGIFKQAPRVPCTAQRPAISSVPAIGPDGTVYVVSKAHLSSRYAYLVAVTQDLKPKWAASLRDRLDDGCGVTMPADAAPNPDGGWGTTDRCRQGAPVGVDPFTNDKPVARVDDTSSSSPVVLPDGTLLYGAYTTYNTDRGHLMHFSASGDYLGNYDFGWDVTPAAYSHDGTYSVLVKDNHYYEFDGDAGSFYLTRLDPGLKPEWRFQNTNTMACQADGGCVADHPNGFEWCINAPAVDSQGSVFSNAEDGNLYVIGADGKEKAHRFLKLAIGAAYTPLALDAKGRIYALNGGDLFVLGQ